MWSEDELRDLDATWCKVPGTGRKAPLLAVATRAVELAAARGGTMTADQVKGVVGLIGRSLIEISLTEHLTTIGAKNAVLEAERDAIKAELAKAYDSPDDTYNLGFMAGVASCQRQLDGLTANHPMSSESSGQVAEDETDLRGILNAFRWTEHSDRWRYEAALSRLAAGAQRAEAAYVEGLSRGFGDATEAIRKRSVEAANLERFILEHGLSAAMRWVVDGRPAWKPPEREAPASDLVETMTVYGGMVGKPMKLLSQTMRYPCSATCTHDDSATPGHPQRVKERSEAFNAQMNTGLNAAHEQGAKAMRAACWEEARYVLQVEGFSEGGSSGLYERFKAAIEGATP